MARDACRPDQAEQEPHHWAEVGRASERVYDAFVVRLWREVGSSRLLRVEIEHAQSGLIANARGVELDWIGARIADFLGESRIPRDSSR